MGATVTTITTMGGASTMAVTVARRVWTVPWTRFTASFASALIPTRNRQKYPNVVSPSTRVMATVTTITTTRDAITMAVTVARRVWAVPWTRFTARIASALIPNLSRIFFTFERYFLKLPSLNLQWGSSEI